MPEMMCGCEVKIDSRTVVQLPVSGRLALSLSFLLKFLHYIFLIYLSFHCYPIFSVHLPALMFLIFSLLSLYLSASVLLFFHLSITLCVSL